MIVCGVTGGILGLVLLFLRRQIPQTVKKALLIVLLADMLGLAAGFAGLNNPTLIDGIKIKRNPAGEGDYQEEVQLWADGIIDKYDYVLNVPEQILTEEEEGAYLRAAQEEIAEEFPGRNESVNCIRTKPVVRSSYQNGKVSAEWLFDNYSVIDADGNIVAKDLPNEGVLVGAVAGLTCGGSECEYHFYFRVFPELMNEQGQFLNDLKTALQNEGEKRGTEYLKLPKKIGNYAVKWVEKKEHIPVKILFIGVILAVLIPVSEHSRKREKQKERQRQLKLEYPEMVSKLALLLGAGMTLGGAWKRIVLSYQQKQEMQRGKTRPVYDEMLLTIRETESGIGEEQAYIRFGERCGLQKYRRFSGMLTRNLKKGNRELMEMLLLESENAFEERKAMAKKYGEEAGTKLLVPMILQLGVIMLMLLVPAFMSFKM